MSMESSRERAGLDTGDARGQAPEIVHLAHNHVMLSVAEHLALAGPISRRIRTVVDDEHDLADRVADRVLARLREENLAKRAATILVDRPDVARLAGCGGTNPADDVAAVGTRFMTVGEYARHARVSERTLRYDLNQMVEGEHFHRDGRKGRRLTIHVMEADAWRVARRPRREQRRDIEAFAIDEVTQRRARMALRRLKGSK